MRSGSAIWQRLPKAFQIKLTADYADFADQFSVAVALWVTCALLTAKRLQLTWIRGSGWRTLPTLSWRRTRALFAGVWRFRRTGWRDGTGRRTMRRFAIRTMGRRKGCRWC